MLQTNPSNAHRQNSIFSSFFSFTPPSPSDIPNIRQEIALSPPRIRLQQRSTMRKLMKIVSYVMAMGVCGLVLVALGSTLEFLAKQVGRNATDIGSVFLARGAGSISGAVVCAKLYRWFPGNFVMTASLALLMLLLALLPYVKYEGLLHFCFFCLGFGTAITDTGCQLMTRKLHGRRAGPWLGLNATIFGLSAALVPLLEVFAPDPFTQYDVLVGIVACSTAFMLLVSLEDQSQRQEEAEFSPLVTLTLITSIPALTP